MKIKRILYLSFALLLVFSIVGASVFAAVQEWKAVKPGYTSYVNGTKVEGMEVMNIDGRTYLQPTALAQFGVTNSYDAVNKVANFTIPQASTVPNTGNTVSWSNLTKQIVRIIKNNQVVGNGIYTAKNQILTSKSFQNIGSFIVKDYKGNNLTIKPIPIKAGERLVLLETIGATTNNVATLASERPKAGEDIALISSLTAVPNMVNFSTVKDYFDFNWLTTGDKEYMRSYNNCNNSMKGGGMFNNNGELVGVFAVSGANYALSITLDDIKSFLD